VALAADLALLVRLKSALPLVLLFLAPVAGAQSTLLLVVPLGLV